MAPGTLGRDLAFGELARKLNPRAEQAAPLAPGWRQGDGPTTGPCSLLVDAAGLGDGDVQHAAHRAGQLDG